MRILNLFHSLAVSTCLAFWYARLRFRISLRKAVRVVIHCGSGGLILTILLNIHSAVKEFK